MAGHARRTAMPVPYLPTAAGLWQAFWDWADHTAQELRHSPALAGPGGAGEEGVVGQPERVEQARRVG